jgi:hypothetical protein
MRDASRIRETEKYLLGPLREALEGWSEGMPGSLSTSPGSNGVDHSEGKSPGMALISLEMALQRVDEALASIQ